MESALGRLNLDVERELSSPQALARLVQSLLEFELESPKQREYLAALIYYVFYKRRREIFRASRRLLPLYHNSGCGPQIDFEEARERARSVEAVLAGEIGFGAVKALKKRVGRMLNLKSCTRRIRESDWDV